MVRAERPADRAHARVHPAGGLPVYQTWFASQSHALSGTVAAPGSREKGLTVRLYAPDGRLVDETTTDARGRYRFGDLATYDGYRVALVRPSGLTSDDPLTRTVDLADADRVVDFRLRAIVPVAVSGTVTAPDDTPRPGVTVTLTGPGPDLTAVTGADGTYTFDEVPPGDGYTLFVVAPDGTTASKDLGVDVPPDSETPVTGQDFVLTPEPRGSATGTVTDEDGAPRPGTRVVVTDGDGKKRVVSADVDGTWSVPDLPPGRYTATVQPPDGVTVRGDATLDVEVPARGGPVDGLDFVLVVPAPPPTYEAGGTVVDSDGSPVPRTTVEVADPDGQPFATARTDDAGRWGVDGLLPAEGWTATVDPPKGYDAEDGTLTFAVPGADVDGLDFVLDRRTSSGGSGSSGSGSSGSSSGSGTTLADTGAPSAAVALVGVLATVAGVALVLRPRRRGRLR